MSYLQDLVGFIHRHQRSHNLTHQILCLDFRKSEVSQVFSDIFCDFFPGIADLFESCSPSGFGAVFQIVVDGDVGKSLILAGQLLP